MRRLPLSVLTVALVALGPTVHAGPAVPTPIQVRQPDGTTFLARIRGDEFQNWVETLDGFTILQNAKTACWEFAVRDWATGELQPSGHVVHPGVPAPAYMERHLAPLRKETERSRHREARLNLRTTRSVERVAGPSTSKVLVIRVSFSDRPLSTPASGWDDRIFKTGAGVKSVRQFFLDNSRGQLDVLPVPHTQLGTPQGIVDVALTTPHPNYGGHGAYSAEIAWLNAALALAAPFVNFASLDTNNDGVIQPTEASIYFIPAGYETSGTSKKPSIWAHAWGGGGVTAGGKHLQDWAMNGELNDADRQHPMGVIAHELGHSLLDLPDLYDTSYANSGLGRFSLMASGSWGGDTGEDMGSTPVNLDAWSRIRLGWTTPLAPPQDGQTLSLGLPLSGPSAALQFKNSSLSATEYWLVENRQPMGWDRGMATWLGPSWQGGLLTVHVDDAISENRYISGRHQKVMAEHANNAAYGSEGNDGSFFRVAGNAAFTPKTTPGATYYDGRASGVGFFAASAPGATMTLRTYAQASARVTPTAYTAVLGEAVPFSAQVSNHAGDDRVNWTVSAGGGAFSLAQTPGNGAPTTLTTGSTVGRYAVTATPLEAEATAGTATLDLVLASSVNVLLTPSALLVTENEPLNLSATVTPITHQTVTWGKSGGVFANQTATAATWSAAMAGPYTLTATSAVATGRSASATITVVAPASVPVISAPDHATAGTSGLGATVPAQAGCTFTWSIAGGTLTSGQGTSSVTFSAGTPGSLTLTCIATNAAGTPSASGTRAITVLPAPTTPAISAPRYASSGSRNLSATTAPQAGCTFTWTVTGGTITAGQGSPTLTFSVGTSRSVSLTCVATNQAGTQSTPGTQTITLVEPPSTPVVTAPAYATTGITGLTATVPAQGKATFQWTASGGTITGGQGSNRITFTAGSPGSLLLGCSASNAAGETSTEGTKAVTILPVPSAPVITAPASVVATFTGQAASVQPQPHCTDYAWTITGGTITAGQGTRSITFTAAAPGSVTLGCTTTNLAGTPSPLGSFTLLAVDPTEVTVDRPTATLPTGGSLSLIGSTHLGSIAWSLPAGQGSLGATSTASGTPTLYTAPAGLMSDLTATLTLTNTTDAAKRATSVITVKTLNVNGDAVLDLRDILALAQDWGSTAARSRLTGGPTVSEADLALLLAALGL